MSGAARIELPRWYACLGPDRPAPAAGDEPVMRVGPLTVFQPTAGCKVVTFGSSADPSVVIFDGYLFGARRLAAEVGVPDETSHATLAAAACQRHGRTVFGVLDGSYLLAMWDAPTRTLLVGRDGLGRHPVFYAATPDGLWISSNVLALASSRRVSNRPNRLSLALAALMWWPQAGETFFEDIRRLRPGHYLEVDSSLLVSERKYWDPLPEDEEPYVPDAEALEAFEPALKQAVDRCLELGAQGIMLSGGVDSVTVAALAAEHQKARGRPPLVAVSGRTGHALSYEEVMQSRVAEALGMPHVVSTIPEWSGGRNVIELSLELTPDLPSPSRIYWVGTYAAFYRQTAARGLHVLLTGAGGDNWLGVAEAHAADLLRALRLIQLVRFMRADTDTGGSSIRSTLRRLLWAWGLRPLLDTAWARLAPAAKARYHRRQAKRGLPDWLCPDPELREALVCALLSRRTPPLAPDGAPPRSYYRQCVRAASNPYMHYEFEVAFHMESASGLRLLSPYHDRQLVSFFNRLSPRVLLHGDRYKGLLRPVVAKYLPDLGLENQRKSYPQDEQRRELMELRQSLAAPWAHARFDTLERLGVIAGSAVRRAMAGSEGQGFDELVRMFAMLSAERWAEVHTAA